MARRRTTLILVLVLCIVALGAAGLVLLQQQRAASQKVTGEHFPGETPEQAAMFAAEKRFWERLEKQKPTYVVNERPCYVEGAAVKVVSGDPQRDNAFGGVTTDLMKIALSPPPKRPGRPSMELQNYDQLLSTCPTCGATYFEIDIVTINGGKPPDAIKKLKSFNMVELAPELDAEPKDEWTYDEQALARFLTQRTAGFPGYELGYTALSGAYNSNVSIGMGREYSIPAAAFYALAAAQFRRHLEQGESEPNKQAASLIAMTLGEMYRLLGRQADAKAAFATARRLGGVDARTAKVLDFVEGLNAQGDFTLQLAPLEDLEEPSVGWYVYKLLPAINGDLEYERENWAGLDEPEQIVKKMRQRIAKH